MKSPKWLHLLYFGCLLLLIIGCVPSQTPTILITPSNSTEVIVAFTSTMASPSLTPTAIVIPSATIATVAVVPTLKPDQAYSLLERIIEGSPSCQLPCWAGIKPGVTTNAEAETLIQPLSILIYGGPFYQYKDKEFSGPAGGRDLFFEDTEIDFVFGWDTERGKYTVELLVVSANALNQNSERMYGSEPYNQLFENYSLHNIISQHGIPSQVWTIAEVYYDGDEEPNPSLSEEFELLVVYDKGILIHYTMPLKRMGDGKGKACPSEAFFNMMLVPPGTSRFYQGMMFPSDANLQDSSPYKLIEESTQMTFDEFYESFKESNSPCFEIPLTIWPKH